MFSRKGERERGREGGGGRCHSRRWQERGGPGNIPGSRNNTNTATGGVKNGQTIVLASVDSHWDRDHSDIARLLDIARPRVGPIQATDCGILGVLS